MREIKIARPIPMNDLSRVPSFLLWVNVMSPVALCTIIVVLPILAGYPDALPPNSLLWIWLPFCFFFAASPVFSLIKMTRRLQEEIRTQQQKIDQLREKMAILRNEDLDLS